MLAMIMSYYVLQYWLCFLLQIWSLLSLEQGFIHLNHCIIIIRCGLSAQDSLSALLEAVVGAMVAMVVVRQLKWLYNKLKVPTVSRIP